MSKEFSAIIMAAGQGTRMKSPLPKVLHPAAGVPMIHHVISAAQGAGAKEIRLIVGHGENLVRQVVEPMGVSCHRQKMQLGTADAVKSAEIDSLEGIVLIVNGDHPLITTADFKKIISEFHNSYMDLGIVVSVLKKPGSLGRILRKNQKLRAIVEVAGASQDILNINEVNAGIYICDADFLKQYLPKIQNNNSKSEYYLTDIVELALADEKIVETITADKSVSFGVNTQIELAKATKVLFKRNIERLLNDGVMFIDPQNTYVESDVSIGAGSIVYPGAYLRRKCEFGKFNVIESNVCAAYVKTGDSVHIKAYSHLESCEIGNKVIIGPFARIRPETKLADEVHIGNFVELKKTNMGKGSKANHLTYLGDAEIGDDVNIGCGTITCNYAIDRKKYKTKIGDRVFVGSDTQFVAPVNIGDDAIIGSGSTITKDVPAKALAVAREKQTNIDNYKSKT